jgi:autotransporter translocation and assembly factor TamB
VLLPAAALVGLLTTDPGLAVVRWGAERTANDALLGEVRIGALTGSAFSTLVLTDLEVRDTAGREALRLDALRLSWRPAELLAGRVHVTALALERPVVRLVRSSSGALNLAELVPPSPPGPEAPPAPLALPRLELDALTLRDGALSFQDGDAAPLSASELQLDLGGTAGGERVQANLRHLSARLLGRHDLRAAAEAQLDGPQARLSQARVDLDDVALRVPELQATLPPGQVEGVVRLRVPPGGRGPAGRPRGAGGGPGAGRAGPAGRRTPRAGPSPPPAPWPGRP